MKNKLILIITNCILILFINQAYAQTYIQGPGALPFSQAVTTNLISNTTRMDYNVAKVIINSFDTLIPRIDSVNDMGGEYFLVNNMVVNLICRNRTTMYDFRPFNDRKATFREMFTSGLGDNSSTELNYYDEIKSMNGFEALVYYYRSDIAKDFIAQDLLGKYVVIGTIYCSENDKTAAETFVNTLLNSITFK